MAIKQSFLIGKLSSKELLIVFGFAFSNCAFAINTGVAEREALDAKCDQGLADACLELGNFYDSGSAIYQSFEKATEYYQKACDLNQAQGCFQLGKLYNFEWSREPDYDEASKYYKKACELGLGASCSNLARLYQVGKGVEQSASKALKLYEKACSLNDTEGCQRAELIRKEENTIDGTNK